MFRYTLTDKGFERLQYLGSPSRDHAGGILIPSSARAREGDVDMRTKKLHTGLYHCSICAYEVDLTAEASLKCEDCGGRLMTGPLPEPQEDDEDEDDEDEHDDDEDDFDEDEEN